MNARGDFRSTNTTRKAKVFIPKDVRGEAVLLPCDEETEAERRARVRASIQSLTGLWKDLGTTDQIMRELRGGDAFPP